MKKVFRKIHLWLAVPFGLIVTLICFSGAMLVFENEVVEWLRHDLFYVKKVEVSQLPVDRIAKTVAATLPDSVSVTGVSISSNPERAWRVNLSKPRRASVLVDQYTGEIKGRSERMPFFMTMFRLHRWLLDSMKPNGEIFWGKMIVGTSTMMFVVVLISGVVVWCPRTKKVLKNSLKITTDKGWRRFWYDLHVAGGMYAFVFLLVMALTGLTWSFSWYRNGFYKMFGVEMKHGSGGHGMSATHGGARAGEKPDGIGRHSSREGRSSFEHWQTVYEELVRRSPDYKQITVSKGTASVSFSRLGNQYAADRYTFDRQNGEITEAALYKDMDASSKIRGWILSVHVGSWGGIITRILAFIAALTGASIPLTGYYLWIRRLKSQNRRMATVSKT